MSVLRMAALLEREGEGKQ